MVLKFSVAEDQNVDHEEKIHRYLMSKKQDEKETHLRKHTVVKLYDAFTSKSANGEHRVIVTNVVRPLLGFNVRYEDAWGIPARQLLEGLDLLHDCHITHLGLSICKMGIAIELTEEDFRKSKEPEPYDKLDQRDDLQWSEHLPRVVWGS